MHFIKFNRSIVLIINSVKFVLDSESLALEVEAEQS